MEIPGAVGNGCSELHSGMLQRIQAACMLINGFEHVASLSSHLELCIWSFENSNRTILGTVLRRELGSMSDAQERRLIGQVSFMKKVVVALKLESLGPDLQGSELGDSLLERLEAAVDDKPISDQRDLAELSFRDQVDLLKKVAALNFESIADPEERQLATSLAKRFIACVGDRVSEKAHSDFMRVQDFSSLKREKLLGKGTFGEVFKVMWLGTPAAERAVLGKGDEANSVGAEFDQEVSILAKQSHPNIVRLLGYVRGEDKCSIVLELMDEDLTELIKERVELKEKSESPNRFPFSTGEVVDIMLQIAEGMDYLQRRRVLHRDLKSGNILVQCEKLELEEGVGFVHAKAKVADFGTSITKERTVTLSHPTWNTGTTRWMAPEFIKVLPRGSVACTGDWYSEWHLFKSDVYSFGMVSYEILT